MQRFMPLVALLASLTLCGQTWEERADHPLDGVRRSGGFVIDDLAYVIGGQIGIMTSASYKYDPDADTWSEISPLPITVASGTSFSIDGKGYYACGTSDGNVFHNELWEYDPVLDTWAERSPFPGEASYGPFSFVIDGLAYVGCGNYGSMEGPFQDEVWRYDPQADAWQQVQNYPGEPTYQVTGFSLNGKGYAIGGSINQSDEEYSVYEYDPIANWWTQKSDAPFACAYVTAIPLQESALIGGSIFNSTDLYEYYPQFDLWYPVSIYPGGSLYTGVGFQVDDRVFFGTGFINGNYYNDLWEFVGYDPVGLPDLHEQEVSLFPNPVTDEAMIKLEDAEKVAWIEAYDMTGRRALAESPVLTEGGLLLERNSLDAGQYLLRLISNDAVLSLSFSVD